MDRDTSFTEYLLSAIENIRETMTAENEGLGLPKLAPFLKPGTITEGSAINIIKYDARNLTVYNLNKFKTDELRFLLNSKKIKLNLSFKQIVVSKTQFTFWCLTIKINELFIPFLFSIGFGRRKYENVYLHFLKVLPVLPCKQKPL